MEKIDNILLQKLDKLLEHYKGVEALLTNIQQRLEGLEFHKTSLIQSQLNDDKETNSMLSLREKEDEYIDENGQEAVKWWMRE